MIFTIVNAICQGAKQQLVQVERMALAGNYSEARLQLRKGSMATVRRDVRSVSCSQQNQVTTLGCFVHLLQC